MARILFEKGAIYTTFKFASCSHADVTNILSVIDGVTKARPSGYKFMPSYRNRTWDGYIKLRKQSSIPTGLLPVVIDTLRSEGYTAVGIENTFRAINVDCSQISPDMFLGITVRDYQVRAAQLACSFGRGILKMATNSGKTLVIASIASVVEGSCLILTTKKDLLYQTSERLSNRLQEPVGIIGDGEWEQERVTVGMIQTLSKHIDRMREGFVDLDCVMFDECHHIPSKTSQAVMFGLQAPIRLGFSGTPLRNDNLDDLVLMAATGPVLMEITNEDLVSVGISAKPTISMHTVESPSFEGSWQEAYKECVVDNVDRNMIVAREVLQARASSTLILVDRIEHGHNLQTLITGSAFVNGETPMDERIEMLDWLREGDEAIVIATNIFGEGVDVPAIDMLVLANGGKGHIKLLQSVGRGMRSKANGNVLHVVDFVDDTNEYLLRHSLIRAEIYEHEGFDVRIVEYE